MESKLDDLLSSVTIGKQTAFEIVEDLDKDGFGGKRLVIESREGEPREPVRAETRARSHLFFAVDGFLAYLLKYGCDATVIYADPMARKVSAVLSENIGDGVEVLELVPQIHPRWKPWDDLLGSVLPLAGLVLFLRDNRRSICKPDGRELLLALSQVRASTEITLHQGSGKNSLNGLLVKSNIQGNESKDVVDLPETITVKTPLFVDESELLIELEIILETKTDGTGISAHFASADIMEARIRSFESIMDKINKDLGKTQMVITYGKPQHRAWEYLK